MGRQNTTLTGDIFKANLCSLPESEKRLSLSVKGFPTFVSFFHFPRCGIAMFVFKASLARLTLNDWPEGKQRGPSKRTKKQQQLELSTRTSSGDLETATNLL